MSLFKGPLRNTQISRMVQKWKRASDWEHYGKTKAPNSSVFVGDVVQVTAGKDKGKTSVVTAVLRKQGRVVVEGMNMKKNVRQPDGRSFGRVFLKEGPLHVSKVALIDPLHKQPTKVNWKNAPIREGGPIQRVRITRLSGAVLPRPPPTFPKFRADKDAPLNAKTDTPADLVSKVTYQPIDWSKYIEMAQTRTDAPDEQYARYALNRFPTTATTAFEIAEMKMKEKVEQGISEDDARNDAEVRELALYQFRK